MESNYLKLIPQELLNIILSFLDNEYVINKIIDVIDIECEQLFALKYDKLYVTIKKLFKEKKLPKKLENCWVTLYEDMDKLDYIIICKILNGEYVYYNLMDKLSFINSITYDIIYTSLISSIKNFNLINLQCIVERHFYSPYTSMYIYLMIDSCIKQVETGISMYDLIVNISSSESSEDYLIISSLLLVLFLGNKDYPEIIDHMKKAKCSDPTAYNIYRKKLSKNDYGLKILDILFN